MHETVPHVVYEFLEVHGGISGVLYNIPLLFGGFQRFLRGVQGPIKDVVG